MSNGGFIKSSGCLVEMGLFGKKRAHEKAIYKVNLSDDVIDGHATYCNKCKKTL